jgi:uncharacterized repeat protein (TIGR02059 family)/uncharacterized delta-60 repeat protein
LLVSNLLVLRYNIKYMFKSRSIAILVLFFISVSIIPIQQAEAHIGIVSSPTSCGALDSSDLKVHASNQVLNRINQASPSNGKDLFSSKVNSTTTPWTRNANIWSSKDTPVDWTGVAAYVYNSGNPNYYPSSRIGTLISPRHFLAATHWPPNPGEQLSFIDANGNQVIRTVVAHQYLGNDLTVGVLDSDVPDTITYYPLVASSTLNSKLQTLDRSFFDVPVIGFNQTPRLVVRNLFSLSNTSQQVTHFEYTTAPYSDYTQSVIGGDSGSPSFILIDGKPILLTAYTGHGSGPAHGAYINQINSAMTALGGGYQVTQYDVSCFSNKTINYAPIPDYSEVIATSTVHQDPSTIIKTFSITDPDSDALQFSLGALTSVSSSTFSTAGTNYFSVNNSGELTQINDLPVDTLGHSLRMTVYATDVDITPGTSTIYATINVDRMETTNILVADSVIEITYDKTVATSSVPATSDFAVTVDGSSRSVSSVSIIGNKVLLGLSSPVGSGQVVRLSYTHGVNPIKDYPSLAKSPALDNVLITNSISGSINTNFVTEDGIAGSGGNPGQLNYVFIDSDSKILTGNFNYVIGVGYRSATSSNLVRINQDGSPDLTFSAIGSGYSVWHVSQQSDGKYIASGYKTDFSEGNGIVRLNTNGSVDNTFVPAAGGWNYALTGGISAIQSDGKIIVGAVGCDVVFGDLTQNCFARLNSDGSIDYTFNNGGAGFMGPVGGISIFDMYIQSDGKIIVAGDFSSYNGVNRTDILRLNADGTLDTTFVSDLSVPGGLTSIWKINVDNQGKIYLGFRDSSLGGSSQKLVYRLNSDGTVDTAFDTKQFTSSSIPSVYIVRALADGKVIVGGQFATYDGVTVNGIVRLLSNGDIDRTFQSGVGIGTSTGKYILDIQQLADESLVAVGYFTTYNGITKNSIVGILNETTSDATSPIIESVTSPASNGTYVVGQTIPIHVVFSEPVVLVGSSPYINLDLNLGTSTVRTATYASGSGSSTLVFNYTVQSGDSTTDLEYINAGSLIIGSGNLEDAVGNHAILTLPVPTLSGSLSANKAIVVDGLIPVPTAAYVTLVFDSTTATTSIPTSNMFTVKVNGSSGFTSVNSVTIDDFAKITLGLSTPVQNGQTITISYTKNSSNIKDLNGNDIASFVDFAVQNNTVAVATPTVSSGGSSSGGSSGGGGGYVAFVTTPTSNNASTTKSTSTIKNTVRVNNISNASSSISLVPNVNETCDAYLIGTMRLGDKNNTEEVLKLQKFLNEFEGENLAVNGSYDSATFQAIVRFQEKYKKHVLLPWGLTRGTGVVSQTTRAKINALVCGRTYGCPYFTEYYRAGASGSEVDKIKSFLNLLNPAAKLNVNSSVYDTKMRLQIISFQNRYKDTVLKPWGLNYATSNWFKTSVSSANEIMGCTN